MEFAWLAVRGGDLPDRVRDGVGRLAGAVHRDKAPGELDVLPVAEALAASEDLVQHQLVFLGHDRSLRARRARAAARGRPGGGTFQA